MKNWIAAIILGLSTFTAQATIIYSNNFDSPATGGADAWWFGGSVTGGAYQQNSQNSDIWFVLNDIRIDDIVDISLDITTSGGWEKVGEFQDYLSITTYSNLTTSPFDYDVNSLVNTTSWDGTTSYHFNDVESLLDDWVVVRFSSDTTYYKELFSIDNVTISVPEPALFGLMGIGLLGLGLARRARSLK